jgi:nucleoside-diphosphate-sugar epimerase
LTAGEEPAGAPRVLVTGGAGFFGTHLLRMFPARDWRVRSLDILPHEGGPGVETVQADVRDAAAVDRATEGCDLVVHNAAMVLITRAGRAFWDVNVTGTRNVLDAAVKHGVRKVLFVSSTTVFGVPARSPVPNDAQLAPIDDYARSKAEAERLCDQYRARGLDVVVLRPQPIVGTGRLGILEVLFDRVRRGRWFPILGKGDHRLQLLGAEDFAEAVWLASTKPCRNEAFNVGAQRFGTVREDLEEFVGRVGSRTKVRGVPAPPVRAGIAVLGALRLSPFEMWHYHMMTRDVFYDTSRIESVLGWKARQSNADCLVDAYRWYLEHRGEEGATAHSKGVGNTLLGRILRHI